MRNEVWFGQNDLKYYFYRFKDSRYYSWFIIALSLTIGFIFFFNIVIPQFNNYFSIRQEVIRTQLKIQTITGNINFMNNLDKSVLDHDFRIANLALPSDKDFGTVLASLTEAAINSKVSLEDYNFDAPDTDLSTESVISSQRDLIPVKLTLVVSGNIESLGAFLKEISTKLPIFEVTDIDGSTGSITVNLQFYYKNLPDHSYQPDEPITQLTTAQNALIQTLSTYVPNGIENKSSVGSGSAVPLF